jgi:hypothetical protein
MQGESEDLLQAVYGLRKAAEAEFEGNAYYQAATAIDGIIEALGWGAGIPAGKDAAYGFASMLADVRKRARASLFVNDYYRVADKLDLLSSFLAPSPTAAESEAKKEAGAASAAATGPANPPLYVFAARRPSFDGLAAMSKGRVAGAIKSLGIGPAHHAVPEAPHREPEPVLADGELERRSSEPCSMAELAPVTVEPVAAAAIFAETVAVFQGNGAANGMGSPAPEAPGGAAEGTAAPAPAQAPVYTAAELSASEHDRAAGAAGQTVEAPGERRLESRSSQSIGQALEAVGPASVPGEIAAGPGARQAALHPGPPAAQSEAGQEAKPSKIEAREGTPSAAQVSAAAPHAHAARAPEKIEAKRADESRPERRRSLFGLLFGRKR